MDLSFYQHMTKAVRDNKQIKAYGWQLSFFRHFDELWHLDATKASLQGSDQKTALLNQVKKAKQLVIKTGKGYFYIEELDTVVEIQPPARKQRNTYEKFIEEVKDALANADNHFNARHDNLTRLLNRNGFESAIKKASLNASSTSLATDSEELYPNKLSVAVITLDIDHFKQINDTYLHDYGDIVLKSFAWKVAEFNKTLSKEYNVKTILGRIGGEEFDLFVYEIKSVEIVDSIAEKLRLHIEAEATPSNQQVQLLRLTANSYPSEKARHITASIGYSIQPINTDTPPLKVYEKLKKQADIALYKAKNNGRNKAINFDQIRRIHGRIHEHYEDTDIVSIDIGREVGVKVGAIYSVFSPRYTGTHPLTIDDKRTVKEIGVFPKICNGRISVIEVQEKISFCQIIKKTFNGQFPKDSKIEYVPMGIIRPLPPSAPLPPTPILLPYDEFLSKLSDANTSKSWDVIFSIRLETIKKATSDDDALETDISMLDRWAETVSHLIRIEFPTSTIGYLRKDLLVVFDECRDITPNQYAEAINRIAEALTQPNKICCGILTKEQENADLQKIINTISAKEMIYCARLAGFYAYSKRRTEEAKSICVFFSELTATEAIFQIRRLGLLEDALFDFHKLSRMGLKGSDFRNQLALIFMYQGGMERMIQAEYLLEKIRIEESNEDVSWFILGNLAYAKTFNSKYSEAFDIFIEFDTKLFSNTSYALALCKCIIELEKAEILEKTEKVTAIIDTLLERLARAKPNSDIEQLWFKDFKGFQKTHQPNNPTPEAQ